MKRFILMLALTTACGASMGARHSTPSPASTVLEVRNNHWEEVTVFLLRGDVPLKLGVVPAMRSERFTLPNSYIGSGIDFRLGAESFAARERVSSEGVSVSPGRRIYWTVEGRLKSSGIMIR